MTIFKAIRDNGPVDLSKGGTVKYVDDVSFSSLLLAKLHEEAEEIARDPRDVNEYGDVLEVLEELASRHGISLDQIRAAQLAKREERGGFSKNRTYRGPFPPMGRVTLGWGEVRKTGYRCPHGQTDSDICPDCRH